MKLSELETFYKVQSRFYDATRWVFLFDRKKAIESLDLRPGDKVIDFACGTGLNIQHILKTKGVKVTGIDYSESMLAIARRKYPEVEFVQGDISTYVFPGKADKAISTYGISMVEEWEKSLVNMKNSLTNEGTLVILDFHPWTLWPLNRAVYPLFRWWLGLHGVFTDKKIFPLLKRHFSSVQERRFHGGYDSVIVAKHPTR